MNNQEISPKKIIPIGFLAIFISLIIFVKSSLNSETTIVFCDVGQGDGTYIRIENKIDMLVDSGPDKKMLECLGKYMPFFDRTIEIAIASHPEKDHIGGFTEIVERYKIGSFLMPDIKNESKTFNKLENALREKQIPVIFPTSGQNIKIRTANLYFLWPEQSFLDSSPSSPEGSNDFSLVFRLAVGSKTILFTGDLSSNLLSTLANSTGKDFLKSDILKIPHHGSKNGLTATFLNLADPMYSVISVGKRNSYRHPAKEILDILKASKTNILRTDEKGDIVFQIH